MFIAKIYYQIHYSCCRRMHTLQLQIFVSKPFEVVGGLIISCGRFSEGMFDGMFNDGTFCMWSTKRTPPSPHSETDNTLGYEEERRRRCKMTFEFLLFFYWFGRVLSIWIHLDELNIAKLYYCTLHSNNKKQFVEDSCSKMRSNLR